MAALAQCELAALGPDDLGQGSAHDVRFVAVEQFAERSIRTADAPGCIDDRHADAPTATVAPVRAPAVAAVPDARPPPADPMIVASQPTPVRVPPPPRPSDPLVQGVRTEPPVVDWADVYTREKTEEDHIVCVEGFVVLPKTCLG